MSPIIAATRVPGSISRSSDGRYAVTNPNTPIRIPTTTYSQLHLSILSKGPIHQVLPDQPAQTEPFVQLPHQDQAAIGSHPGSLKGDAQKPVERELKGLILALTYWVSTSARILGAWFPHQHRR